MSDASKRRAGLTESRRKLLEARLRGRTPTAGPSAAAPRSAGDAIPATPLQRQLWAFAARHPASPAYHMQSAVRLRGSLDVARLEAAINAIIERHEALRTVFTLEDRGLMQRVLPSFPLSVSVVAHCPDPLTAAAAELVRPFDLARLPLLRVTVYREGPRQHVLLLVVHHIVIDEWSLDLFWSEVSALYGGRSPLAPVVRQFPEHALDLEQRSAANAPGHAAFWREALDGVANALRLPLDHPRPAAPTFDGAFIREPLSASCIARANDLATQHGTTPFVVLCSAFGLLLSRLTGQRDFVVGVPVAHRSGPGTAALCGLLIQSLPLRFRIAPGATFVGLLTETRRRFLDGLEHAELPFEAPTYQAMFVIETDPLPKIALTGLTAERVELDGGSAKFDLTLFVNPAAPDPSLALEFNTALFRPASARRILRRYAHLLSQVVGEPSGPLAALDALSPEDLEWLASIESGPALPPALEPLPERIRRAAGGAPDATAVVCGGRRLTYAQLLAEAGALAARLAEQGVRAGDRVAIELDRSTEQISAIVGVLWAGAAYVPLDPSYPAARRRWVLGDLGDAAGGRPTVVVTREGSVVDSDDAVRVVHVDDLGEGDTGGGSPLATDPASTAYVIYTSGSSGRPKGVPISHANLAASIQARLDYYDRPESYLLVPSFAFDSSVAGIFWVLAAGGTLVLPPPDASRDPRAIGRAIRDAGVTHTLLLPSLWRFVLEAAEPGDLASLTSVIVAGEACDGDLVRRHHAALPGVALFNEYGPTEATVWATVHRCGPEDAGPRVPIGRPIAGARALVLDEQGRRVPPGVAGDLHLGGAGIAAGYLARREETALRFLPDPERAGGLLYRTGDRVRHRHDGALEFLGRVDEQLKIRGFRVEPAEIEARLRAHPEIQEAAVVAVGADGPDAAARLVAFFESATELDAGEIRERLRRELQEFMVPAAFVRTERLPRLPSGKVDRRALAESDAAGATGPPRSREVPRLTGDEGELAGLWRRVLGIERVHPDDDFFDLGGHSLLGVRLLLDVKQRFGVEIPLADLFTAPTLRAMAVRLRSPGSAAGVVAPVQTAGSRPPLFCVHQGGRLFADVMGPDQPVYLVFDNISTTSADTSSVQRIAAHYLEGIRRVQPHGPYYLLGYSFGGMVAYELAIQLRAAGESVSALGLMDPPPVSGTRRMLAYRKLNNLRLARGPGQKLRFLRSEIALRFRPFAPSSATRAAEPNPEERIRASNIRLYAEVGRTYTYPPSDLPCALYLQEGHPLWMRYITRRWKTLFHGPVSVDVAWGAHTHRDIGRPPHDLRIARSFAAIVRRAQDRDAGSG